MTTLESDLLIIGAGLAGVTAAVKASEVGVKDIIVVSKGKLGKDSLSTFAAGIFQVAFPDDDKEALFKMYTSEDVWGGGVCNEEWLDVYLNESWDRLLDMERWGVTWLKDKEGRILRQEGRWKLPMAMFHGEQMMEEMARKVSQCGIKIIGHTMITDLLTESGKPGERVTGALGFEVRTGEFRVFKAKATILAAGSCAFKGRYAGQKFQTGESYVMSYNAGAILGNFEMGDILHTTAKDYDLHGLNMYVGLGGKFINANGKAFMLDYDPELGNSSSMNRISECSAMEIRAGRGPIYLDMTHFTPEDIAKMRKVLPTPTKIMEMAKIIVNDKITKPVEWVPVFFGTVGAGGGVITNTRCETSLPGLYACGDAVARMKHFPKALAGAAVTGSRAGIFASEYTAACTVMPKVRTEQIEKCFEDLSRPLKRKNGVEPAHVIIAMQETLFPYEIMVIAHLDRLEKAIREIERLQVEEIPLLSAADAHNLRLAMEAKNMLLVTEMYLKSRLIRTESRDGCLREDFPCTDNANWLKVTKLKQESGAMKIWAEDLPLSNRINPSNEKTVHRVFEIARKKEIPWG